MLGLGVLVARFALLGPGAVGVWRMLRAGSCSRACCCARAGVLVIAIAQRQMGESFRIGIDDAKTALVSRGLFRHVRNPIYSGCSSCCSV